MPALHYTCTVADPMFWEGANFVEFANELPSLRDSVTVVGFPIGGETVSNSSHTRAWAG